jgi:hypothetical protein
VDLCVEQIRNLLSEVFGLFKSYVAKNWELLAVTDQYGWSDCLVCEGRSARLKNQHCETQLSYNLLTSIRIIHRIDKGPCFRQLLYFFRPFFVTFRKMELNLEVCWTEWPGYISYWEMRLFCVGHCIVGNGGLVYMILLKVWTLDLKSCFYKNYLIFLFHWELMIWKRTVILVDTTCNWVSVVT